MSKGPGPHIGRAGHRAELLASELDESLSFLEEIESAEHLGVFVHSPLLLEEGLE